MTATLEKAVSLANELPPERQDSLAAVMLAEMDSEQRWDGQFASQPNKLAGLAAQALAEFERAETRPWRDSRDLAHD
ncbi:MAG: hypothetical protein B9S33_14885 [Pedosphaera sp. Tous-C6FEB]|nr:MAG: hypothetical protein B9S33_14885 [Pedosphaera sp. Tous-C6FEB]